MEVPSKLLEEIAFNTRPTRNEPMLTVMNKSTHKEHLSQPLQTNTKQFKIAVTFLTSYNGIFNVTNSNKKFYFKKSITDEDGLIQVTVFLGAYETESSNNENKRIIIDEGHFSETNYPFTMQPNFSTLESILEISPQGPIISFMFDDSIRELLGFNASTICEEYNLSPNPVGILSFDNMFLECDIAQRMIFKGKSSGITINYNMDVDPGYKYIEKLRGNVQWYMMESQDIISSICFELKNESKELVSFNGQSIIFRFFFKEI